MEDSSFFFLQSKLFLLQNMKLTKWYNFLVCEFLCFANGKFDKSLWNFAPRETAKIANYGVMSFRQFHDLPQTCLWLTKLLVITPVSMNHSMMKGELLKNITPPPVSSVWGSKSSLLSRKECQKSNKIFLNGPFFLFLQEEVCWGRTRHSPRLPRSGRH